ncbi:hypothetical protein ESY87_06040 [Subsaximicrobium wynnwilliamsii]|uniref:hypothetical protein n=1 Tax=Subsaximicrobium wynnwilliamsii TaxID=291179 RepID=UPI0011BE3737|nr:hypothetical protein [Subsaximicrobium wynnwilliamsii]TXD84071.1 hypothetical protein ESY87_06040 [Subsaximicrobium wynnwilliamsii]TXE03783.1 hypothetical protein ESY88_06035 [Subsaximicrobium wynnwilliamsii]
MGTFNFAPLPTGRQVRGSTSRQASLREHKHSNVTLLKINAVEDDDEDEDEDEDENKDEEELV